MASIFLSYAREDLGAAKALASALERIGHSVWWDRHIKGGTQFAAEIEAALGKADAVVVLWSPASIGSPWVRDEASAARDSGRLVPATLGGAMPPMGFRQYQSVDLTGWKHRRQSKLFSALEEAVEVVLAGKGMPERSIAEPTKAPQRRMRLIAMVAVLLIISAAAIYLYREKWAASGPIALAVLPFDAVPADATNSPFAEGLAEEISGELARNPRLQLIGRTSASMFKNSDADARTIGRKLGVTYLVDGSVRRAGRQIRIGVELIRASDGVSLWRHTYTGTIDNIFAIQDRIGASVEGQLRASFVGKEGVTARSLATRGDVYSYYLTARTILREPGKNSGSRIEAIKAAEDMLRKAVALDPNYAPGWAQLSGAMFVQREFVGETGDDLHRLLREAATYSDRALKLAPQLAEAHYAKARSLVGTEGRPEGNFSGLKTAVRLDPNNADAWFSLGNYYDWAGDFAAEMDARRKAVALEPLWVLAFLPALDTAWELGFDEEAERYASKTERDADPQPYYAHMMRGYRAYRNGDWSRSLAESLAARRTVDSGHRIYLNWAISDALRVVGELELARPLWGDGAMDDLYWNLWHGQPPPPRELARLTGKDRGIWMNSSTLSPLLKSVVNRGRSVELVEIYRRRFGSPDKLQPYPAGHKGFVVDATTFAIALRDVGNAEEADRVLGLVRQSVDERMRRWRVPRQYYFYASLAAAAQGDDQTALQWLEKATSNKWWYAQEQQLLDISDEPAFRKLKANPRFQTIAAQQRAWQAKERREMAPMLAEARQK